MSCINEYPTTACDAKNDNRKLNTIASYATKKFGIEYQGFLLRFCTHRNEFVFSGSRNCVNTQPYLELCKADFYSSSCLYEA